MVNSKVISMKKVAVIGYFGDGIQECRDGQGIKTTILTEELERALGKNNVDRVNTYKWKKHPVSFAYKCREAVKQHDNVIFLCAVNGLRVFPRMLETFNIRHNCKIHYYVVGGFLLEYLEKHKGLIRSLQRLDSIYVELQSMKDNLEAIGFTNVLYVNKFRRMNPIPRDSIVTSVSVPFKLCFFARVMKEKGIEDVVQVVKEINEDCCKAAFSLDIYGAVEPMYSEAFSTLQEDFPPEIRYLGVVNFRNSQNVLAKYNALVFPTYYYGEGYPNTIVDAFSAALPVLASRWHFNEEIIRNYSDGILFDTHNLQQFKDALMYIVNNHDDYIKMRYACLQRCEEYSPENAVKIVLANLYK